MVYWASKFIGLVFFIVQCSADGFVKGYQKHYYLELIRPQVTPFEDGDVILIA